MSVKGVTDEAERFEDDDCEPDYCGRCGGEGYVEGGDIASAYDFGWIDEDAFYPCPECHHRRGLDSGGAGA